MKLRHLDLLLLLFAVMVSVAPAAHGIEAPAQLALSGEGHLTGAWIPDDGPALVAWESTETGWSKVVVYENGERAHEWEFADTLVKDARWLVPGKSLRLGVVTAAGSETRVYSVAADGSLEIIGSTAELKSKWDNVSLSPDGNRWVAATFGDEKAMLVGGELGTDQPSWQWEIPTSAAGPADPRAIDELNRVELVSGPGGETIVALVWNGRIVLADEDSPRRVVPIEPPGDCDHVQSFTAAAGGLWVQCSRGLEATPGSLWGYYAATLPAGSVRPEAQVLAAFRKPWFRPDGTVVDLDARLGKAQVFAVVAGRSEPVHLGRLELPVAGARYTPAGDVLLETTGSTEEYRVIPFGDRISALRASAGLAESPALR